MASASAAKGSQPKILEDIVEAGKKAFDPNLDAATRESGLTEYNEIINRTETWILLPALNTLIKPDVLPPWLREPVMQTLTRLPLRADGVRGTMEFIFSVHPSNLGKSSSEPQKQGASITHEALAVVTKLLASVPSSMAPEDWFNGISPQLFRLMDGAEGQDLKKPAAQIVGFGILGQRRYGAPGSPGWNIFVQPLLEDLNPSLANNKEDEIKVKNEDPDVIDLSQDRVLVKAGALARALRRLSILLLSNPSPGLSRRILKPVLIQIWSLASWLNPLTPTDEQFCKPARDLLRAYLRLFGKPESIWPIIQNLLTKGSLQGSQPMWKYRLLANGDIDIVEPRSLHSMPEQGLNWNELEDKCVIFVNLLTTNCSTEEVSSMFLSLLRRWIQSAGKSSEQMDIDVKIEDAAPESNSPVQDLLEVTILQKLMDKAPEKLISHFDQLLELVCQVFRADAQANLGDDLVAVVLSLLNLVVTAPTFQKSDINPKELDIVETSLERLSNEDRAQVSPTARNLSLLLKYRDEVDRSEEPTSAPSNRQIEDRKTYSLAMNYITGGNDNPAPVVSEGLNLLSGLIVAESPILDIPAIAVLMSNLLADNEDYINLRVIKVFTQIANKHPKSVVQEILDHYLDAQERSSTDVRLRFGEALLQVIERLGETFAGDVAQQVGETLLSIAGRRGHRSKTMKKQARDERLKSMKAKAADEADASDLDEDEDLTEQDRANNDILAQIVQGWESKRGSEDVRMRASALSIFGTALETNIAGLGPTLVSASVDLCINVLTMERGLETAILRRAAIMNVLGFVRALSLAKESKKSLGFGLTDDSRADIVKTLQYVAATDQDGLVKQHAEDVIESLENWQLIGLLPDQRQPAIPELTRLAGLHVNPEGTLVDASGQARPRIEEVE